MLNDDILVGTCIGQHGGHGRPRTGQLRCRTSIPGFLDHMIDVSQAPEGWPCLGLLHVTLPEQETQSFHVAVITIYNRLFESGTPYISEPLTFADGTTIDYRDRPPDLPHPKLVNGRRSDGVIGTGLFNIDHGMPPEIAQRLINVWNAIVSEGEIGTNGPPPGPPSSIPRVTVPRRRGTAGDPNLFEKAVNAYRMLEDYYDEPNETDVAQHLGIGRTTLWRALRDMGKDFAAVKMTARQSETAE